MVLATALQRPFSSVPYTCPPAFPPGRHLGLSWPYQAGGWGLGVLGGEILPIFFQSRERLGMQLSLYFPTKSTPDNLGKGAKRAVRPLPLPLFHPNLPVLVASSQDPDPKSGPNLMEKDHQFVKPASGAAETQGNPHFSHILFDLGKRASSVT